MIRKFYALLLLLPAITFGQELDLGLLENLNIRNVGPANMSGRITAIAVAASNPKIIVVGAASGGVWKSTNGGSAWTPIFDDQPTQNIGAIAIQRDNPEVIWVGTGEGNPRNSVNLGMGLFKSEDGGKSWKHLGLEATKSIHRILIDPSNSDTVYIGAHGDPFTPNAHRGLYKTTDGGMHFERILFTNETSGVADMLMHPQNPNRIYVALYDHRRTPYSFVSGGPGSGLFVTDNGGS
ncbi:MAG: WD40/YVTN/BNR-like repeat-containing protein, partial [Flavobacteriaceae bacterium]